MFQELTTGASKWVCIRKNLSEEMMVKLRPDREEEISLIFVGVEGMCFL